ncbi:Fascin-like incomplete domain containing protein [Pandoravirus quercus]|uniref:Fascin-like incomplete domain containing protein n=1 Tax=Pandoravirus quercus TaxID=2107709 RepID=A0A2U7U961_9VIRU|nr:Fascin-like incomplete domain containing protein [Pandoravirus quercus]AVK74969.1 Fascin-like incomplete domain containing protein [Pandoravirus quercus]
MTIVIFKATVALAALLCCIAAPIDAYRYTVFLGASTNWTAPVGATGISASLWGGGGGSASSFRCGAGGGSGSAILNRTVGDSQWAVAPSDVQWIVTVGKGGTTLSDDNYDGGSGGDGGQTSIVAVGPGGAELFRATAYGGGGAWAAFYEWDTCRGGAGGGAASSAGGTTPGTGNPPGAADNDALSGPSQGAIVGDVKAGGAGSGFGHVGGDPDQPFIHGAGWTSPGRNWAGGQGTVSGIYMDCFTWGGAAGFNGNGGYGYRTAEGRQPPPANSGSGGGSGRSCPPIGANALNAPGADGGVIIEYNHPVGPTPSNTPAPSPSSSPTRTPSSTPTPSAQPLWQLVTLVSPISGKQLTPQEDGSVASLWVGASYKEMWVVSRLSNGKYTFKGFNNRYLGADPGGWVRAEAASVGPWEQWDVLINAGNQWTLKSTHGTYMGTTAAGVIYLNNNAALYWTKTTV